MKYLLTSGKFKKRNKKQVVSPMVHNEMYWDLWTRVSQIQIENSDDTMSSLIKHCRNRYLKVNGLLPMDYEIKPVALRMYADLKMNNMIDKFNRIREDIYNELDLD